MHGKQVRTALSAIAIEARVQGNGEQIAALLPSPF
jgi:hypothetical protein